MYIRSNWPYDIPNGRFYQQMLVEAHEQCQQAYDKCEGQLFPVDRKVLKEDIAALGRAESVRCKRHDCPLRGRFLFPQQA
jgi:hypothetical protein